MKNLTRILTLAILLLMVNIAYAQFQSSISFNTISSNCSYSIVDLFGSVSGGTPPYTYLWSYNDGSGTITSNIEDPQQVTISAYDPVISLLVTDATGSSYMTYHTFQNSYLVNHYASITHQILSEDCANTEFQLFGFSDSVIVSWEWELEAGQTTQSATGQNPIFTVYSGLSQAFATLTVYDANNCASTKNYTVPIDSSLVVYGYANILYGSTCTGANCNTTVTFEAHQGAPPYLYSINQGTSSSNPVFTNLCDGIYDARVEDANGCFYDFDFTIQSNLNGLNLHGSIYNPACTGASGGNPPGIYSFASGGTPPYSYNWSNGASTSSISSIAPGTYSVIVTDASGCSVSESFILPTNNCYVISGYVYRDNNGDCVLDANDYGIANGFIRLLDANGNSLPQYSYTNSNGYYEVHIPAGNYFFEANGPWYSNYTQQCPSSNFNITVDASNPSETVDFFLNPPPPTQDLKVFIGHNTNVAPSTIPGQNRKSYISYHNTGTYSMSGTVVWNYSPELIYAGPGLANITPDIIDQTNHQLTFNFSNLQPLESQYIDIQFDVPNNLQVGTVINDEVIINPIATDATPTDNTANSSVLSVASYDPNDKSVYPTGDITVDDNDHHYNIRFQNEGNANATRVVVRDLLDEDLDVESLRDIHSSHNFVLSIENGNELVFTFDNIQLPPKDVNEAASQGYIAFSVSQLDELPVGTSIENTADIYFDFNPAIVTNTVVNTIVDKSTGIDQNDVSIKAEVYPNPSTGIVNVTVEDEVIIEGVIVLDVIGNPVFKNNEVQDRHILLNLSNINDGVYFVQINTNRGSSVKRIIVNNQ